MDEDKGLLKRYAVARVIGWTILAAGVFAIAVLVRMSGCIPT
jgi:hypothetical protein